MLFNLNFLIRRFLTTRTLACIEIYYKVFIYDYFPMFYAALVGTYVLYVNTLRITCLVTLLENKKVSTCYG